MTNLRDAQAWLNRQLAFDYCLTEQEAAGPGNCFTVFERREGQRTFDGADKAPLKIAVVNNKLLFTGDEDLVGICKEKYADAKAPWFMDAPAFAFLEGVLAKKNCRIKTVHPFFLPYDTPELHVDMDYALVRYDREGIMRFKGDERFCEAFAYDPQAPDMLAVAAVKDGEILGMAGASADSPSFWQIGINVMPFAEHRHIASVLVSALRDDILKAGKMPYYGAALSNLVSQRVAANCGFRPAWVELLSERL